MAVANSQVVDPTRGTARFHHHQVDFEILEERRQVVAVRGCRLELIGTRIRVLKAAHCLEFAEV